MKGRADKSEVKQQEKGMKKKLVTLLPGGRMVVYG